MSAISGASDVPEMTVVSGDMDLAQSKPKSSRGSSSTSSRGAAYDFEIESTLDEPVSQTIMRDVKAVLQKFKHVFIPRKSKLLLKEWDLWGPLVLCTTLAMLLHDSSKESLKQMSGPEFVEIFVIFWVGAIVVTINSKLVGGTLSYFQSICVLGYCSLPLTLVTIICRLLYSMSDSTLTHIIAITLTFVGLGWCVFAATAFLSDSHPEDRRALGVYPICLFYFLIAWIIIAHTNQAVHSPKTTS